MDSSSSFYKIKRISFLNRANVPIVLQNENGPCPLLAICNVLLLKNQINIHPDCSEISQDSLLHLLVQRMLDSNENTEGKSEEYVKNQQKNIDDAISRLFRLTTGIDVNVRFQHILDFEFTPEIAIFDLLDIRLVHGWLVDKQDTVTKSVLNSLSYNEVMEILVSSQAAHPDLAASILNNTLDDNYFELESKFKRNSSSVGLLRQTSSPSSSSSTCSPFVPDLIAPNPQNTTSAPQLKKENFALNADSVSENAVTEKSAGEETIKNESKSTHLLSSIPNLMDEIIPSFSDENNPAIDSSSQSSFENHDINNPFSSLNFPSSQSLTTNDILESEGVHKIYGDNLRNGEVEHAISLSLKNLNLNSKNDQETPVDILQSNGSDPTVTDDDKRPFPSSENYERSLSSSNNKTFTTHDSNRASDGGSYTDDAVNTDDLDDHLRSSKTHLKQTDEGTPSLQNASSQSNKIQELEQHSEEIRKVLVLHRFLTETASQLSYFGLFSLQENIRERELCVFFRNNHFSTLFKYNNFLYLLATDQGYLNEKTIVWERLSQIEGDNLFVNSNFESSHSSNKSWHQEGVYPEISNSTHDCNSDWEIAKALQEQEEIESEIFRQKNTERNIGGIAGENASNSTYSTNANRNTYLSNSSTARESHPSKPHDSFAPGRLFTGSVPPRASKYGTSYPRSKSTEKKSKDCVLM